MPPKSKAGDGNSNTQVFLVWSPTGDVSVHATLKSASESFPAGETNFTISSKNLVGGTVTISEEKEKPASKAKAAAKSKAVKVEDEDEEEEPPVKAAPPKKTKTPAEQRAANADKAAKPKDTDLPDNVKALLKKGGDVFEGQTVIVTGVPPTLGRKNTERLVEAFGAHLGKSLSKKTSYVVVGNDAGPKKLLQIEDLGLKTLDEDELIALLEGGSGGTKRAASDEEDEEEEEEEKPKPKAKRQKKK